jgi:hypothetical protein
MLSSCSASVQASLVQAFAVRDPNLNANREAGTQKHERQFLALPLSLLVFRVRADHPHHAAAPDHFALVADPLD